MQGLPEGLEALFGAPPEPRHTFNVQVEAEISLAQFESVEMIDGDPRHIRIIMNTTEQADSAQQIDLGRLFNEKVEVTVVGMSTTLKAERKPAPDIVRDQGI